MAGGTWRRAGMAGTGGHEVAKNTGGRGGLGRTRLRPRDLLSISTLVKLPSTLSTLRSFMNAVNWTAAQEEISGELGHKVAILGMANSGKSTLFNTMRGQYSSPVSAEAGTTKQLGPGGFGAFPLNDTPGPIPDPPACAYKRSCAVIYLRY